MASVLGKKSKIYLKYLLKEIIKKLILINFNYFILKLITNTYNNGN